MGEVGEQYVFDGPSGKETLAELFEKRSQLIVYHFMFSPEWDEGCKSCSFWADTFNSNVVHLNHRDVTFVVISRAPLAKIEPFKKRMGWSFKWVSSFQNDFNFDYQASFTPEQIQSGAAFYNYSKTDPGETDREGVSVFYKDERGAVFHTYSCYARGIDMLNGAYQYLDRLRAVEAQISMDGRGRALDNIFTERLWRSVKYEEVYLNEYLNPRQARQGLTRYFHFYNDERPHQALGYLTPAQVYFNPALFLTNGTNINER